MGKNEYEVIDGITNLKIISKKYGTFYSKIDDWIIKHIDGIKWGIKYNHHGSPGRDYYVQGYCEKEMLLHNFITVQHPNGKHIDHIHHPLDNRIASLRYVTPQENMFNRPTTKGYTKLSNCYRAQIKVYGQITYLGYFDTPEQARAAYLAKKAELHIIENEPAISRF